MHELDLLIREKFPELDQKQFLDSIREKASVISVKEGDIVIDYGNYIRSVPLVVKGTLKVMREDHKGNEIFLYYLSGGDTCAASFSCCLVQKRSEIKAIAEEDSTFIAIPLAAADYWMGKHPVWRNFVFNMYDQKMYQLIDTIDRLAFTKLDEQLIDYLDQRSHVIGEKTIEITHQRIASDLYASREAISRLLKKLENQGKLKLERNKIILLT